MQTEYNLIINGQQVAGANGSFSVLNPATETEVAQCPQASVAQLDEAVAAAQDAFKSWKNTSQQQRQQLLHAIADGIEANAEQLAEILVAEQGKPLFLAQIEVGASAAWTRYNADLEIPVEIIEDADNKRIEVHRKPLGVVGSITPWNWPLMIAVWHIMPALRSGNTVVSKPSGVTPFSTIKLVEIINQHLPAGVCNIVTGESGIGSGITRHPGINKIVFTGSTETGQTIMRGAADNLKRLTLELGGNDAGIVLADADVDTMAEGIFQTAFLNMGQTCAALKRLYVHDSIYEQMCSKLAELASAQVVGNGADEGVTFGPVTNQEQLDLVTELVDDVRDQSVRILSGGEPLAGQGYFYPPTIIADAKQGMRIVDEEQFGPVLPVIRYSDLDDAIAQANACDEGLGGSVWSTDLEKAQQVASQLECGTVWINSHAEVLPHAPFGGCKMSGFGVEFGLEGLLEYTHPQVVNINK